MRAAAWEEDAKTWGQQFYLAIGHAAQWATQRIDGIQLGLDGLGLIPIVGNAFDGINVGISVVRGNWGDAGVNVVAMVPGVGQGVKGAHLANNSAGIFVLAFGKIKKVAGKVDDVVPRRLTNADIEDYAALLLDGRLKPKHLKKAGFSPEDIADIKAKSKQLRPRIHDAQKIIDDITKSENGVRNALERVRQNPGDSFLLGELEDAQHQLRQIREAFEVLRRRDRGF